METERVRKSGGRVWEWVWDEELMRLTVGVLLPKEGWN